MNIEEKSYSATKWSTLTQVAQKAVTPLTNIILAHILAPEIFGIVASITLIISFLDVFTEAGFQKYLVFCDVKDGDEFGKIASVAFWVNLALSLILFLLIVFLRDPLASLVGVAGKGTAVVVAALALPLTSFSSIQNAVFQRKLQYKKLFLLRCIGTIIPIVITVPLALLGMNYWALLIGKVAANLYSAVALTIASSWKPSLYFDLRKLKAMASYCSWSLGESITTWLATNLDVLLVSGLLSSYYLGLYKTTISLVNELLRLVSSSLLPVTYSIISRLREDDMRFNRVVYSSQSLLASIVIPMGFGLFVFSDLAVDVALGSQWHEAAKLLGYWSLASCLSIAFEYICDDVYRAKGCPNLSFVTHLAYTLFLIPAVYFSAKVGYWLLIIVRPLTVLFSFVIRAIALRKCSTIRMGSFIKSSLTTLISATAMAVFGVLVKNIFDGLLWQILVILICIIIYFTLLRLLPNGKEKIHSIISIINANEAPEDRNEN